MLFLGAIFIIIAVFMIVLVALAFIGAPDDLNDIDIDGKPKQHRKTSKD